MKTTSTRRTSVAVPSVPNLTTALVGYWPGDEASGNLMDSTTNHQVLGDTNTVTNAVGLVYPTARQYTKATTEYHTRNSSSLLQAGDTDFTIAAWVNADSYTAASLASIAGKYVDLNALEYLIRANGPTWGDCFTFTVSNNGTAEVAVAATAPSPLVAGTWYLVIGWHDSVANTINIQVNNGPVYSAAHATGVYAGSTPFRVGFNLGTWYWNGRIGPTMFWKSAAGGGGVLSEAQRKALYNNGAGLRYEDFGWSQKPRIVICFDDGYDDNYTVAYPILSAAGVPGTIYIISDNVGGGGENITLAHLQALDAKGWSIANHSKTHANFTTLTQAEIETELDGCRDALDAWGLTGASAHVAYPFGAYDADTLAAMTAQGMLTGRTINDGIQNVPLSANTPHLLNTRYIMDTTPVATVKGYIDAATRSWQSQILVFHKIVVGVPASAEEYNAADFAEIVAYAAGAKADCVNIASLYAAP